MSGERLQDHWSSGLSCLSNFLKNVWVGSYENLFVFFWKAIKIAGSVQKNKVGHESGNTHTFFLGLTDHH